MKEPNTLIISILLILLPVIPAFLFNFPAFLVTSLIGLAIVLWYFVRYLPWKGIQNAIISTYFTGIYSFGLALGVFFALPMKPRVFAEVSLIESIPFIISILYVLRALIFKLVNKSIVKVGNGYFAMLIVLIIGAVAGRFFHNFYELIILYSGFLILGIITYLYFKE
ncbi:hypothetical protein [Acidianus sp. RZ1]|uniref:hypothetical protein n=1 Tax=Acidianus sp. RZ1 TaxID=1540082 RepID=UPI001491EAA5|nr:hypothetical protein [Acidianus sp. RZ1]NON63662.1 hypothetical protein [Acidianus sp. RZ1]